MGQDVKFFDVMQLSQALTKHQYYSVSLKIQQDSVLEMHAKKNGHRVVSSKI